MFKIISAFIIILISFRTQAQSISERTVDSSGNILIFTTIDTIGTDARYLAVDGFIYNVDSVNNYVFDFYFSSPYNFLLTDKDKIYIRYSDGAVYNVSSFSEGSFFTQGQDANISIEVSKNALNKMLQYSVKSISIVTDKFRYTIPVNSADKKVFENLAHFMLNVNVYDENVIKQSELTKMKSSDN